MLTAHVDQIAHWKHSRMDDQQTLPDHGDPGGESPLPEAQPPGERRRGALSFVIVFLVVTIILLVLGRYAVNTRFMNWYLFQVAGHTSWVLDVIGYSSGLEDPAMYRDRAAAVRAELDARRRSEDAPVRPENEFDSAPLEPYEIWQYRSLLLARQLAHTEEMAALTAPRETAVLDSDEERIAHLRESLNRLTKSTYFVGAAGTVQVMATELGPLLEASEETVSALERGQRPEGVSLDSVLEQLDRQIAAGLDQQHAYLESRAIQLSLQIHDRHGPTVDFIARAGLTTQLRDAEANLRSAQQNTEVSETIREERIDTWKSKVDSLKKARETATENRDAEADQDRRFRFNVVPDCGALPSMSIFLAAMIAFPTELWRRLLGLLIGLPLLYAINIARLTCLALIGAYTGNGQIFEFAHEYVWQAVYIVFVVIVWLMWVEFIVRPKARQKTENTSPLIPLQRGADLKIPRIL
jgi:exosortase/archaeosortase family protein